MTNRIKYLFLLLVLPALPILFGFTDVDESHWAYSAVTQLVNNGVVSGFEDGSFRPNEPVTRAQMVKMVGYSLPERRTDRPSDLRRLHWSYDYIMNSPLRFADGKAFPDEAMTRNDAAVYLYDCFANGEKSDAPSVIFGDTQNRNEIGWVYEHGIMVGDDGINLRLSDTLTRAEAAVLIVNSRDKLGTTTDFSDNISDATLEKVFNGSHLFDFPYQEGRVLTNGEAARAAYRLSLDRVDGLWYRESADFEHEYANDLKAFEFILGEGRISAEFADMPAQPEDAFSLLAYGIVSKVRTVNYGYGTLNEYYKDARPLNEAQNAALTFAYKNGVRLCAGGLLKTGVPVTAKAMASVLLQYDTLWGLSTSYTTDGGSLAENDEKMRFDLLPQNAGDYAAVLQSVPNEVYDAPYFMTEGFTMNENLDPDDNYAYHTAMAEVYYISLMNMAKDVSDSCGAKVGFTFYPHLVYDSGEQFIVRARADIASMGNAKSAEELFGSLRVISGEARDGGTLWIEIPFDYLFFMQS